MAKKLTEKALIKKLDGMNQEELKKIIVDLYKCNKSVEEGMSLLLLGEEYGSVLLEKYKKRVYKIFNPTNIVKTDRIFFGKCTDGTVGFCRCMCK